VKQILSMLFALAVVVTTTSTVYACTNATLNTKYALTDTGFFSPHRPVIGPESPVAAVGVVTFDGNGNASFNFTLSLNGAIFTSQSDTGTYTVNSDCTGSISFTTGDFAPFNFNIVIIGGGTEIFGIFADSGNTQTFDAKKQ